jgi:succinate-acetate transporter protein
MTSPDARADESHRARAQVEVEEVTPESAPTGPLTGDPTGLGLACFIMGAVALGLSLVGVVPARALGAPLAIILGATTVGLIITTIWAAALGQSAVAAVFGIFAAFWASYFLLVTGLIRAWFGILPRDVTATVELFLITWLVVVVMLTLATLRLPVSFTAVFVLVAQLRTGVERPGEDRRVCPAGGGRRGCLSVLQLALAGHRRQGAPARLAAPEVRAAAP